MTTSDGHAFRAAVLIPAYQCAATIAPVVADARRHFDAVVVVDDGSDDGTAERARLAGAEVLCHARNRGKGAALLTGMQHLAARGYTHALTMDGDGQHLGGEIPTLLAAARTDPAAIVIGVRTIGSQEVAAANLFGNRVANVAIRVAAGTVVGDTQSGFRVYPLATVLPLPVDGRRFEYESTVIIRAARAEIPVKSVPVAVYYPPIAERRSHYRKVVDTLRIIRAVASLLIRH
ncbi:MAG: glycosyltransferase family 2 protein [Deltaproteobacteria bacterium]|nr:glycosyltransferase family 2 protein [Deltaproteobacteria bacterium]